MVTNKRPPRKKSFRYYENNCLYVSEETAPFHCRTCGTETPHGIFVMPDNEGTTYPVYWCLTCKPSLKSGMDET